MAKAMAESLRQLPGPLEDHPLLLLPIAATVLLLSWRLWRFSVIPALYPEDPKELPYWVPFVGHARGFFRNSNHVLERARRYFGATKEPYAITLAGESIYVVTSPQDVADIYRNTSTVSWHNFVRELYTWIGLSPASIKNMWAAPSSQTKTEKSKARPPHEMIEEYHRQQLHPGDRFNTLLGEKILPAINENLNLENLSTHPACLEASAESVTISLWNWCTDTFINGMTNAYYGKQLSEITPDLLRPYMIWEATSWKYMYHLPRFLSEDMHAAKDEIIHTFRTYFQTSKAGRTDSSWFVEAVEEELRQCALDSDEVARINMLHHWVINGNVYKVCFWTVAYLAHNPALLEAIRTEITPAITINGVPDTKYLVDQCPRLEALFNEVLRVNMASALMREVTAPTVMGGKVLRRGMKIMVPYRQLHFDPEAWGPNVYDFDPERFLNDKGAHRNPSYRPFGGGNTLCPGRFVARHIVFAYVALLLTRFEIELNSGGYEGSKPETKGVQPFPRVDDTKPGLGALGPVHGDDVILTLTPSKG